MNWRRLTGWLTFAAVATVLGIWLVSAPRTSGPFLNPAAPRRIASLTLATDEMLADLVPPERLACVTALADDPEISNVAGRFPANVTRLGNSDPERIIALAPDLVCAAPYNTADSLKLLERSGMAIYLNESVHGLDEIEAGLRKFGERVGEPARAQRLVEQFQARRQGLARRLQNLPHRPRVLFWSAGATSGRGTTIDDVIREAGGLNVAAELGLDESPDMAPERVLAADPDVILLSRWSADQEQAQIGRHAILRHLRAVREHHLVTIEGRYLLCVSQFALEGVERLARALHPDRFAAEAPP